jgi:hypothetical protein
VYARVSTWRGSDEQIERGLAIYREDLLPWLRDATGFRGSAILHDRETERALGITFWDTREAAADPDSSGLTLREEIGAAVGALLEGNDIYEVALTEQIGLEEE